MHIVHSLVPSISDMSLKMERTGRLPFTDIYWEKMCPHVSTVGPVLIVRI